MCQNTEIETVFEDTDIDSSNLSKSNKVVYNKAHIHHHKHKRFN